jgi:hypothetical protein
MLVLPEQAASSRTAKIRINVRKLNRNKRSQANLENSISMISRLMKVKIK